MNPCSHCGSSHAPKQCPALGQTFYKCHGNNHYFRQNVPFQSRPPSTKPRVYEVRKEESTNESSTEEKELFIGELMTTAGNVSKSVV